MLLFNHAPATKSIYKIILTVKLGYSRSDLIDTTLEHTGVVHIQ